jgi:hypothetical protein
VDILPIIKNAVVSVVTEFDIRADVLVSIALFASVVIGEHFAAGEIAFIHGIGVDFAFAFVFLFRQEICHAATAG